MSDACDPAVNDAVNDLLRRMAEAWERGDGPGYAAVFSEDAQYVNAPGERMHGRTAIAESHQKIFDTFFRRTRLGSGYPHQLRPLTPEIVLVESCGAVLFPGEIEQKVPPNGLITLVVVNRDGVWRIVSFQNTPTGSWRTLKFFSRYLVSRLKR